MMERGGTGVGTVFRSFRGDGNCGDLHSGDRFPGFDPAISGSFIERKMCRHFGGIIAGAGGNSHSLRTAINGNNRQW